MKNERISYDLPAVPHSLRAFIEKAVKDDRTMFMFIESPITTLQAAGVPIKTECLTQADCDRLNRVLGKLRNLVASGKIPKEFRFEEVFTIGANVMYEQVRTSTETFIEKNFDHSTEGHDMEKKSSTVQGTMKNFDSQGMPVRYINDIIAPLINPGDLAAITTLMLSKIVNTYQI